MSQHPPPNGYSHHRGQPPPQQHSYEPSQIYPPQTYNESHVHVIDLTGAPIQNAFNYNANRIPGLAIGGGGGVDDNTTDAPAWIARNGFGDIIQPMSETVVSPAAGDLSRDSANHAGSSRSQRIVAPPRQKPVAVAAHAALNSDIEEGELSEGQFEDLYEPVASAEPTVNARELPVPLAAINDSGVVSAADTPETAFYGNDEEEAGANITKKGDTAVSRERSGSYSPFLSPGESPNDDPSSPEVVDIGQSLKPSASHAAHQRSDKGKQVMPGLQLAPQQLQAGSVNIRSAQPPLPPNQDHPTSFKSLEEARKEAIKAILRLWHLGVRYQQYTEEGFDEKVIKSLFNHLNLDIKDSQSNQQDKLSASSPGQPAQQREAAKNDPAVISKNDSAASGLTEKAEERKDRIARLLAAKAAKPPAASRQTPPAQPQTAKVPEKKMVVPTAPAAMSRSKTWGEKEILLQQKIAALQEAQARKATNGKPHPRPTQTQMARKENDASGQTPPETVPIPSPVALKTGTGPDQLAKDSEISQPVPKPIPSIPGLLLSSIPTGPARNQRKRPVASDFVDQPSSTPRSHKRPFGQNRSETSFVIDVTDGSDDDEMDMDMESPLEDSSSFPQAGMALQRGPSIRDFPPLTDTFPPRQFSSPVPSSNTPSGHPILSKKRETELDIKEKEIQEMRRKIAEAEARRKAKQYSGGSQTPDSKDNEQASGSDRADGQVLQASTSPRLPKKPESSHQIDKAERRGRIVSLDIPKTDDTLEAKMNRLKKLREEEMRLEAEINNQLAQKKLSAEEPGDFGESSSDDNAQLNGLSSNDPSIVNTPKPGNSSGSNDPNDPSIVTTPKPENSSRNQQASPAAVYNDFEHNEGAGDISMDESSLQSSPMQRPIERVPYQLPSPVGITTESGPKVADNTHEGSQPLVGAVMEAPKPNSTSSANHGLTDIPSGSSGGAVLLADARPEVDQHTDSLGSDDPAPMDLESPSPSLSANRTSNEIADDEVVLLDQISNVARPREDVQEIEIVSKTNREVHVVSPKDSRHNSLTFWKDNVQPLKQQSEPGTFVPYKSPLRYFHAYRFHPSYSETVGGGLKSLTYSNRINPEKIFCPSELFGKQCPANCEYQHFRSINTPNDQILLELGKADEYSGEQKSRFIQGLRKLLQAIRNDDHHDFESIAREIIQYRSRFLGDKSKVLSLEGVTI